MGRLARDGTAEPVSRDRILKHVRRQGNIHFPCSPDHEQDRHPYPVDPNSAICDNHTYLTFVEEGAHGERETAKGTKERCSRIVMGKYCT